MKQHPLRQYISLILLFVPPVLFIALYVFFRDHIKINTGAMILNCPWQFFIIGISGIIATIGGVLDWQYHRSPLNMKIPKKERDAEVAALGFGGLPMFFLMWFAMVSNKPNDFLIPIVLVLIYTVVAISYDEFVFHIKRCTKIENLYHRMLVFGNCIAWLSWFQFIYSR